MSTETITKPAATDTNFGRRRPLGQLAADRMRAGTTPLLGRVLRETGRKSIEVAAFASSV